MISQDFHVHTIYCDGRDSPEEIILDAISRGMKKLGFSGHSYTPFDEEPCMSPVDAKNYRHVINSLKHKYKSQIEIFCGIECDYYSDINPEDYDYVIGSVHYINCNGQYRHVDNTPEMLIDAANECFNGDMYALVERYYETVADVVNKTRADIIGHLDLVAKLNDIHKFFDEDDERYINASNRALDELLRTGKIFEINTGAVARGYKNFPYPSLRILTRIAENNGRVILSSDSHSKDTLMYKFNEYENLAKSIGLTIVEDFPER